EDGIRDRNVTGVQTCALPILSPWASRPRAAPQHRPTPLQARAGSAPHRPAAAAAAPLRAGCSLPRQARTRVYTTAPVTPRQTGQIGRASCRETGEVAGVGARE